MTLENGYSILCAISSEIYREQVNWGRVVSLHLFVSLVLQELSLENRLTDIHEKAMSRWLGDCLSKITAWIENQHESDGWISFSINFESVESKVFSFLTNVFVGGVLLSYIFYKIL